MFYSFFFFFSGRNRIENNDCQPAPKVWTFRKIFTRDKRSVCARLAYTPGVIITFYAGGPRSPAPLFAASSSYLYGTRHIRYGMRLRVRDIVPEWILLLRAHIGQGCTGRLTSLLRARVHARFHESGQRRFRLITRPRDNIWRKLQQKSPPPPFSSRSIILRTNNFILFTRLPVWTIIVKQSFYVINCNSLR